MMRRSCVVVLCVAAACTSASKPAGDEAEASAQASAPAGEGRGRLKLSLPAWASVAVDGTPQQADASVEVAAGSHEVSVTTPCGVLTHEVQVEPGGTKSVRAVDVPWLADARLQLEVKGKDGARLPATVTLRDGYGKPVEEGEGLVTDVPTDGGALEVPACRLRMTVRASKEEGLGGFVEDVELVDGETLKREVVLLPGPDLVRIAGGTYVAGPTPEQRKRYSYDDHYKNETHAVQTFDIDRHEVTVADLQACVKAGGCDVREFSTIQGPTRHNRGECNVLTAVGPQKTLFHQTKEGRERHPANCLAMVEAEQYCKWAGKRLPMNFEWEYAARSGKTEYKWPWGTDESRCRVHGAMYVGDDELCPSRKGTTEVCSYPEGNSEQGLCDLIGNVGEFAAPSRLIGEEAGVRGGDYQATTRAYFMGAPPQDSSIRSIPVTRWQTPNAGFRCARDVKGAGK